MRWRVRRIALSPSVLLELIAAGKEVSAAGIGRAGGTTAVEPHSQLGVLVLLCFPGAPNALRGQRSQLPDAVQQGEGLEAPRPASRRLLVSQR